MHQIDYVVKIGDYTYKILAYELPSKNRWRAEAAQAGRVVESIDGAGQLASRVGIFNRLRRLHQIKEKQR